MRLESDLSANQRDAIAEFHRQKNLVLTSDCGFGKSVVALTLARDLVALGATVLIVGNAEGVKNVWCTEYTQWEHLAHLKVSPLIGTKPNREKALAEPANIYTISYNSLGWLSTSTHPKFDVVIADECSCLKGATSKWRKALLKLSAHSTHRLGLTATPKTKNEDDYWGIARWVDNGRLLGQSIGEFRANYMKPITMGRTVMWQMRNKSACDEVRSLVAPLFVEYHLSAAATIPIEKHIIAHDLRPESQAIYDAFAVQGLQGLNEQNVQRRAQPSDLKPMSALVISGKLATLSSGFIYEKVIQEASLQDLLEATSAKSLLRDSVSRTALPIFDDRIRLLKRVIHAIHKKHGASKNICICYTYKFELEQLKAAFPSGVDDLNKPQDAWNAGEIPYLFLQFSRSSKSLNLQHGGHIMVFYSRTFKFEDDYQIVRRLARQGQKAPTVFLYVLHFNKTMDAQKGTAMGQRFVGHKAMQQLITKTSQQP